MPISHAVLALLSEGPGYGYQLRASFQRAVGPQWGGLNIGHLYQVLDRLVRDELVVASRAPQADRPDRVVYTLTDAGRAELERWLAEPAERGTGFRDEFILKLLAAAPRGVDRVLDVVREQRRHEYQRLRDITALTRQSGDDALVALLVEAARLHAQADLALLDVAEQQAAALAGSHPVTGEDQRPTVSSIGESADDGSTTDRSA